MFLSLWTRPRRQVSARRRTRPVETAVESLEERWLLSNWSGDIPNGTVWASGQVQRIMGDVHIPAGSTLMIQPGAVVKFNNYTLNFTVDGTLMAQGTSGAPIVFTELRDDTGGDTNGDGGATSPGNSSWGRLEFKSGSTGSVLNHVDLRYGGYNSPGELFVNGGQLTLSNSVIRNSGTPGVRIQTSNPTLNDNSFLNNTGAAVSMDLASNPAISGVTVTNNGVNGLALDTGTLAVNSTWNDPDIIYWLKEDITVPAGKSLTVAPGQVIKRPYYADLIVNGTLTANGTAVAPVIFTEWRDDAAGGDTNNDGTLSSPVKGNTGVIQFSNTSTGNVLDHVEVRYAGYSAGVAAIVVDGASLRLTNSLIRNSGTGGLRIQSANPTVTGNSFQNNTAAAISMNLASNPTISGNSLAGNDVNGLVLDTGTLAVNSTWNNPDIVYWFKDDITVPQGKTLTIAPGQVIKRPYYGDLWVNGSLIANGTSAAPIVFSEQRDDTAGGDTNGNGAGSSPSNGNTGVIQFSDTSTGNVLDHVEVRYAGYSSSIAALVVDGAPLSITNSLVRNSGTGGLRIQSANPTVTGNSFQNNTAAAISMNLASNPTINGDTLTDNDVNGLVLDSGTLTDNAVWNNPEIVYWFKDDITVPEGKTLTVAPGQVVKRPYYGDFIVNGSLVADGTVTAPIVFTEWNDDTAGGDTNGDGTASSPVNGGAGVIQFSSTSAGNVMDHVEVRYSGYGNSAAVVVNGGSLEVANGLIRNSGHAGLQAKLNGTLDIRNSLVANNTETGIRGDSGATVTAFNNTIDGNVRGIAVDGTGTVLELTNNLVTNNSRAGIVVTNAGVLTARYNDVLNPGAPDGNYNGLPNATGTNGNLSVDPLYGNRSTLNFHLLATSPVIDAATSDGAPIDDLDFNSRIDNLAVSNTGDGTSPYFDMGAYEFGGKARAVKHTPSGDVSESVTSLVFTFREAMDTTSFSPGSDVVSFTGPAGPLTVTGFQWKNKYQLEVDFATQAKAGEYQLALGPNLLNANGLALDGDGDGVRGENLDDRYAASWTIVPPRVVSQSPLDYIANTVDRVSLTFDRPMDPLSFALADVISFKGPNGPIPVTGFHWVDARTLEIVFATQTTLGSYEMVLGPNISDIGGNLLDQSGNGVPGEVSADRYTAAFTLANIAFVAGNITQNTTWGGLIIVDDNVTVQTGVTLTLSPGTIVKIRDLKGITVQAGATFVSNGTTAQSVRITSIHDDTVGGDSDQNGDRIAAEPGDWNQVLNQGTATFNHTQILYGSGVGSTGLNGGAIHNSGGTVIFSNSVLSQAFYDGLDSVYGNVTIVNSLLIGADRAIVSTYAGTSISIVNSTLDNNRIGIFAQSGGGITLKNSIVANSLEVGVDTTSGPQSVTYSDVYTTVANAVNFRGMASPIGTQGNVSVDSKFVNSDTGDYRPSFGSPVIDAADGSLAPATDFAGSPRFDVPSVTNTGTPTTTGAFADLGAFEFVEGALSNLDLSVIAVTGPSTAAAGDTVTVHWTAKNTGSEVVTGDWNDAVYLSTDATLSADDLLLGQFLQSGPLGLNQSYGGSTSIKLPVVFPNDYYFLVRANSNDAVFEGQNRDNNLAATAEPTAIALDLPDLTVGTALSGQFSLASDFTYYRLNVPDGGTISISLDSAAASGGTEMYLASGVLPTPTSYDFRSSSGFQPDQVLTLPYADATTYYLLVRAIGGNAGTASYTVTASHPAFGVDNISPIQGGNTGQVTISVNGSNLTLITQVSLIGPDQTVLHPIATYFRNESVIYATFDLTGAAPGHYDLRAVSSSRIVDTDEINGPIVGTVQVDGQDVAVRAATEVAGDVTLPDAFEVIPGTESALSTRLLLPSQVRLGRVFPFQLEISNNGPNDLVSPPTLIQSPDGTPISLTADVSGSSPAEVQVLPLSDRGMPTVLKPGERVLVTLYALAIHVPDLRINVIDLTSPGLALNWDTLEPLYRDDTPDAVWSQTWSNFRSIVGNTWDGLNIAMRRAAEDAAISQPGLQYVDCQNLMSLLFSRAELGQTDVSEFARFPTGTDVADILGLTTGMQLSPEMPHELNSMGDALDLNVSVAEVAAALDAAQATFDDDDCCAAFRPITPEKAAINIAYANTYVIAALIAKAGTTTADVFAEYLHNSGPTYHSYSENDPIVTGTTYVRGFKNSITTQGVMKNLWDKALTDIRKRMNPKLAAPGTGIDIESLPADTPKEYPLTDFFKASQLDSTISPFSTQRDGPNPDYYFADALHYGGEGDGNTIPGLLAGGVGKTDKSIAPELRKSYGSDVFGDDQRKITGGIILTRVTDGAGHTIEVKAESNIKLYVKDAVDFCPGDLGEGFSVRAATVTLARLEANGFAHDVGFDLQFQTETMNAVVFRNSQFAPPKPSPLPTPVDGDSASVLTGHDPNDIIGPAGVGTGHWILPTDPLPYRVDFENDAVLATAPAQDVFVTNTLDPDMDLSTFELGTITFGSVVLEPPSGQMSFTTTVETTNPDGSPLLVEIHASLNQSTRVATWTFHSMDPLTLLYPADPEAGFLPPNDTTHRGEGYVTYLVRPKASLSTGARLDNLASIVFDTNDPLTTNAVFNTIDSGTPTSSVTPLPATSPANFLVSWSGNDDAGGSGIASYDVYVSTDATDYILWQNATSATSAVYPGQLEHTYRFYSVARDHAGHREPAPTIPDATTIVSNSPPVIEDQSFDVAENSVANTIVGSVRASDPDVPTVLTYEITAGNLNNSLTIDPTTGLIKVAAGAMLDFEAIPTYTLTVRVTDNGSPTLSTSAQVTIHVTDVNEAPSISSVADQTIQEDSSTGILPVSIGDPETPIGNLTFNVTSSNNVLIPNGNIVVTGFGADRGLVITPAANQNGTATITMTLSDGILSSSRTFQIVVQAVDDPTLISLNSQPLLFHVKAKKVVPIDGTATITDPDSSTLLFAGSTLHVSGQAAKDTLSILKLGGISAKGKNVLSGKTIIGTMEGGKKATPLTIHFTAAATQASVQTVLRGIGFKSTDKVAGDRTIKIQITNIGGSNTNQSSRQIQVRP